jgi:multiple sugar transport system ATP-binding protein
MTVAEIRIQNLHKSFAQFTAVRDSSMTIANGQFFVLLGPSGCGKTTTLRMIAGLEIPTSGQILLDGEEVTRLRAAQRDIAFVFQFFALYPHMNVSENLGFPLRTQGTPRAEIRRRVEEIARLLRIDHLLGLPVSGLAGGDRQRVALGRAIIRRPKAFLMDEPLGARDAEFRELMCGELRRLHDRIGATTVYVTHDQLEAMAMGDRIAVMNAGEVLQVGPPQEVYDRPRDLFVAGFIGSPAMNFLPLESAAERGATAVSVAGAKVEVPRLHAGVAAGDGVLGVRPEQIHIEPHGRVRGRVFAVEYMGASQLVTVETDAGRLRVKSSNTVPVAPGDNVGLALDAARVIVFERASRRAVPSDLMGEAAHA